MGILLAFLPFIVFAILDLVTGSAEALAAGACVSAVLIVRELAGGRGPKILETGTCVLFAGLALYAWHSGAHWSVIRARLYADAGLLLIVLASMAMGRPFTLQYAKSQVSPAVWSQPEFIRTNYVISGAWAFAFVIMLAAEFALLYVPQLPRRAGVIVIILALIGAMKFSGWYPAQLKQRA